MKRFLLLGMTGMAVAATAWLIGCGGGDGEDRALTPGDTNAVEYQFVSALVGDDVLGGVEQSLDLTFLFWDSIPGVSAVGRRPFGEMAAQEGEDVVISTYTYSYSNGWHIFSFEGSISDGEATVEMGGVDSVRLLAAGVPMQVPDESVDALVIRAEFAVSFGPGIAELAGDYDFEVSGLTPTMATPITVSGSTNESAMFSFEDTTGSCELAMTNAVAVDEIVILYGSDGCPSAGSVGAVATLDLECLSSSEELDIDGTWELSGEFDNGTVTVTYNDGTHYWQATEDCGPSGVVSKLTEPVF